MGMAVGPSPARQTNGLGGTELSIRYPPTTVPSSPTAYARTWSPATGGVTFTAAPPGVQRRNDLPPESLISTWPALFMSTTVESPLAATPAAVRMSDMPPPGVQKNGCR